MAARFGCDRGSTVTIFEPQFHELDSKSCWHPSSELDQIGASCKGAILSCCIKYLSSSTEVFPPCKFVPHSQIWIAPSYQGHEGVVTNHVYTRHTFLEENYECHSFVSPRLWCRYRTVVLGGHSLETGVDGLYHGALIVSRSQFPANDLRLALLKAFPRHSPRRLVNSSARSIQNFEQ